MLNLIDKKKKKNTHYSFVQASKLKTQKHIPVINAVICGLSWNMKYVITACELKCIKSYTINDVQIK